MSTDHPGGIVTPEAVVLDLETAGITSRGMAAALDLLIQWTAMGLIFSAAAVLSAPFSFDQTAVVVFALLMLFAVIFGYPALMESLWSGQTLGKAVMGLRVVTREGGPVRFRHAAIRSMTRILEVVGLLGAPAILSVMLTRDNQRIGDLAAGTIVLRERTGAPRPNPVSFRPPAGYERYAASLDVSALTPAQYEVIRSYLLRSAELTPEARSVLGVRIANPVAHRLRHRPPPHLTPEMFLAAVASAYQARHPAALTDLSGTGSYV